MKMNKDLCYKQLAGMILVSFFASTALEAVSTATQPVVIKRNVQRLPATQRLNKTLTSTVKPLAKLEDWRFSPKALQLEMTLSAASKPHYFYLTQPSRIVVDLPDTKLGHVSTRENYSGTIQSVRVAQLKTGVTRIVMDLAPGTFLDPKQVQLQPVSSNNPTHWVLRPLITSYRSPSPSRDYPPKSTNPQSTTIAPQPPNTKPLSTGLSQPPQPPNSHPLSTGLSTSPQPPNSQPSSTGLSNSQQSPNFSVPPPLTSLPSTNSNNQQLPFVSVPPLSRNTSSEVPTSKLPASSLLPPASFSNQPGNSSNTPSMSAPNFPVLTVPSNTPSSSDSNVINFGQPLPSSTN
jgi:hypothetical protein